jgi:hypothetical protein
MQSRLFNLKFIVASALFVALAMPTVLHAGATGTVSYKGKTWKVADAVAAQAFMGYELSFSPLPWDRAAWAEDGKFDSLDIGRFQDEKESNYFTIKLGSDKIYRSHELSVGAFSPGEGKGSKGAEGLKVESFTKQKIVGRFKFSDSDYQVDLRFDLPLLGRDAPLELPGVALPANGGEPGKAFLATLAAMASGDVAKMLAVSAPDRAQKFAEAAKKPEFAAQLAMQSAMQPTGVQITGGKIDTHRAWVLFKGNRDSKPMSGTAVMELINGRWYMKKMNTRS